MQKDGAEDEGLAHVVSADVSGILDAVNLPIVLVGCDCRITCFNRAASELLGLNSPDIGQIPCNLPALAHIKELKNLCDQVIAGNTTHRCEIQNGEQWYILRIAPHATNNRQKSGAVFTFSNITQLRESILRAVHEREFTKTILNAGVEPLVVLDRELRIKTANRAFYELFGVSREKVKDVILSDLGTESWKTSRIWSSLEAMLFRNQKFRSIEINREFPMGRRAILIDARGLPQGDTETDTEKLALLTMRDITEIKLGEETMSRLAAVVESSEDAIISKTLEGTILSWNLAAERVFGYTANEAIGKQISIIFPPERLNEEHHIIDRLTNGERIEQLETIRIKKDAGLIDVSLSISPIKDTNGNIVAISTIARDISQQKRAAKELSDQARILEILNNTGKIIGSNLDVEKVVQTVTDAGTELSGAEFGAFFYNVVNASGESFLLYALSGAKREAFEKFGLPRNTPIFEPTFRGKGLVRSGDITKDPRYGTMAPHYGMPKDHLPVRSYLAASVISRSGEVIGGLFFGHSKPDVFTERAERLLAGIASQAAAAIDNARLYEAKKSEVEQRKIADQKTQSAMHEAERANRAKDEFLAVVSHELRTPLTAMLGWARLMKSGELDAAQFANGIRVIERNVTVQKQLIEDLLDISRIITGKMSLAVTRVDLPQVISAAIDSIQPAADMKRIKIEQIMPLQINSIAGDAGRLQQVFWNLLSNAVKFTPNGGEIKIQVEQINSAVHVTVKDNGKGIEPEFLPQLFERFRQSNSTNTREYGGLGLGLALVRYLVEQHGGKASAHSNGIGRGSQFVVELPIRSILHTASSDISSARVLPVSKKPLTGIRILVVEDEADSRDLILTVLKNAGAVGVGVGSVDEALSEFECCVPDVLLSDIGMPHKNGHDLIREVRKRASEAGGKVPSLALTAYARDEDRLNALALGFDLHVSKPIDPADLVQKLVRLIR